MKKILSIPTIILLLLVITGCTVAKASLSELNTSEVKSGEPSISQVKISSTATAWPTKEQVQDFSSISATSTSKIKESLEMASPNQRPEVLPPTPTIDNLSDEVDCHLLADWPIYTVQYGDTLVGIASRANTTVATLMGANCLSDPDRLAVGQTLYLPVEINAKPSPTATPAPPWIHYSDSTYQVEFDYPAHWSQVGDGVSIRFEGEDGFVSLLAIGSSSDLDTVTSNEAAHRLMPYGKSPIIQPINLTDGREARLILPSLELDRPGERRASLITYYDEPIAPLGTECNYFQLIADAAHIQQIAGTLVLPAPRATVTIEDFSASTKDLQTGGKRITFNWTTSGATHAIIVSGTAERFAPWWTVNASGELTVELDNTQFANPTMTLLAINDVSGEETTQTLSIPWPCEPTYFFEPAPTGCPREAAQVVPGVIQHFQAGFMIWLPRPQYTYPSIYTFLNSGEVRFFEDTWTEKDPERDPNLEPPQGLFQPIRGFGKVWRQSAWVRDNIGWAVEGEYGYAITFQPGAYESLEEILYLSLPDTTILRLNGFNWRSLSN